MKRIFFIPILFFTFILSCSLLPREITGAGDEKVIILNKTGTKLSVGETVKLTATIKNGEDVDYQKLVWSIISPSPEVITILGSGDSITACANTIGLAQIKVKLTDSVFALCDILVEDATTDPTVSRYISTTEETTLSITVGDEFSLSAKLENSTPAEQQDLTWFSSNPDILTLLGNGSTVIVNALAIGNTQIIVTHPDAANTLTFYIKISKKDKRISFNTTSMMLDVGKQDTLIVSIVNAAPGDQDNIIWSTLPNDSNAVSILGSGASIVIMANNPGNLKIVASTETHSAYCDVIVTEPRQLSVNPGNVTLNLGESETLRITKSPENLLLSVSSSNSSVVSCDYDQTNNTITVTALDEGSAIIMVSGGGLYTKADIKVQVDRLFNVSTPLISIEPTQTGSFTYSIQPQNETIEWTIGNPSIASFSVNTATQEITVTPQKEGATIITGRTSTGLMRSVDLNIWYNSLSVTYNWSITGGDNDSDGSRDNTYLSGNNIRCGDRRRLQIDLAFPQTGITIHSIEWNPSVFHDDLNFNSLNSGNRITLYFEPGWSLTDFLEDSGTLTVTINYGNNKTYSQTFNVEVWWQAM